MKYSPIASRNIFPIVYFLTQDFISRFKNTEKSRKKMPANTSTLAILFGLFLHQNGHTNEIQWEKWKNQQIPNQRIYSRKVCHQIVHALETDLHEYLLTVEITIQYWMIQRLRYAKEKIRRFLCFFFRKILKIEFHEEHEWMPFFMRMSAKQAQFFKSKRFIFLSQRMFRCITSVYVEFMDYVYRIVVTYEIDDQQINHLA